YDIVEGPVANDNVTDRIIEYLENRVSKADFLKELSYHRPNHQICLCTLKSFVFSQLSDKTTKLYLEKSMKC
ncbi:MAG: DUF3990 domain-containing protein, partial [Bacteroidales bacterium]|nr:DUF3990 domain-containing protein [Bacteroidales bacterium]